ncbi:MAG: hypothetical protein ACR5KV_02135 [Wolbachia sp.]
MLAPFIICAAVVFAVIVAFSIVKIRKNNTIFEKDAQLASQAKKIKGKNEAISDQVKDRDISNLKNQLNEEKQEKINSEEDTQLDRLKN